MNYISNMRCKEDSELTTFGKHLRALRRSKGLRQEDLAKALRVSRDKIVYYELRAHNPTMDFVMKAAEYFGVTVDELLWEDNARRNNRGPVSRLERQLRMIRQLPTEEQKAVSTMLDMALRSCSSNVLHDTLATR